MSRFSKILYIQQLIMDNTPAGQLSGNSSMVSSPKKHNNPIGLESTWSFGWQDHSQNSSNRPNTAKTSNSYHNQSSIVFGDPKGDFRKEESKPADITRKKVSTESQPVWNYNPKNAGKTTMVLGDEKPDYRKKDEFYKQRTPTTLYGTRKK